MVPYRRRPPPEERHPIDAIFLGFVTVIGYNVYKESEVTVSTPSTPSRSASGRRAPPRRTAVFSDLHLSDVEEAPPGLPLWRRFKHRDLLADARLVRFLDHIRELGGPGPVELVLNGDVFDFDCVRAVPVRPPFPVTWLERLRGLLPEEAKSAWKMRRILADHPVFVRALGDFVRDGNELVFVIGNHDLELHWPAVQAELRSALALGAEDQSAVRICEFFVVSGGDTLITHGNQLDHYCVCPDPVHPFIEVGGRLRVRSPFGNLAGKLMLNGMGLFNPHVDDSFIKPLAQHVQFFVRDLARYQPLIAWSWLWSAFATLVVSLYEGFLPAHREPLQMAAREAAVARRSRSSARVVRALHAVAVHPAIFDPIRVMRELWLDRALLLAAVFFASYQVFSALRLVSGAGAWGATVAFVALMVPFVMYARNVRSEVKAAEANIQRRVGVMARIAKVRRVVMGHTHHEMHRRSDGVEYLNTGHWSPAFEDLACTRPVGRNAFAWIAPGPDGERVAELRAYTDPGSERIPEPPRAPAAAPARRASATVPIRAS